MKLTQLRCLLAIAETGSFSEAALQLGMSQSSVSGSLSALEAHLECTLIERGRFGARLTGIGQEVVVHARAVLSAAEGLEQQVALYKGKVQGQLVICTFRSMASQVIPPLMRHLRPLHPELQLQLLESTTCEPISLLKPLEDGSADLAFIPDHDYLAFLSWVVMEDPYVALLPEGWGAGEVFHPQHLLQHPLILSRCEHCAGRILQYLDGHGLVPKEVLQVQDDFTMYSMVAQQLGWCLNPRLAIDFVPPGTRMLPLALPLGRTIRLAVRSGGLRLPAVRHFMQALKTLLPDSALPETAPQSQSS
ncbi:LysR family transcriptional regulator [Deinococcus cellulosilyticus]|uniref:HTH lysR-type domain-containing protein n=1 Tax=Deinococcus cellulosilyticus (strain DSM 18568 / NBRC 106333 / KACC 11606 / 5516J-15) TaxID=1223518 RepID=A0A511N275_DEIC1|nr:LysR family transcriptional regulator [Deinococcus cellulosilyticus]GEM46949.1 hypothetical protein DC3_25840 [Deinococcus cellulosilyticus NBRC 106333 = KACC 11606]